MATRYQKAKRSGRKLSGRKLSGHKRSGHKRSGRRTLRRRGGVAGDFFNLKVAETSGALVDKLFGGGTK
jgi:hypothetical protein